MRARAQLVALAVIVAAAGGASALAGDPQPNRITFGESVRGEPLRAVRISEARGGPVMLVVGAIHGDEDEGQEIVRRVRRRYENLRGVEVWLVRSANPDGVAANTRGNAHGVDLNRNFRYRWSGASSPGDFEYSGPEPFSEPESRAVRRLVKRIEPDLTIWYHQPRGTVLFPCSGEAPFQQLYSDVSGLPPERCFGENLPGTATSWQAKRFGGTHFVVELPGGEITSGAVERHARAVARVARMLAGDERARGSFPKPEIELDKIPYGDVRKRQMAGYSKRHYGDREWQLIDRDAIVLHYTADGTYEGVHAFFAANQPNLGERPGVCAQYVVDQDGAIYQLVRPGIRCRHTIGLNHRSIGIEMVQDATPNPHDASQAILDRRPQIRSALRLVAWLSTRFEIRLRDVIGHAMANDSPYFKDLQGWSNDHVDWQEPEVREFRQRLRRLLD